MSDVYIITEGQSESTFIRELVSPYSALSGISIYASIIGTPGHKGENIVFERFSNYARLFLLQRSDTFLSTMFDYYRLDSQWPGMDELQKRRNHGENLSKKTISQVLNEKTKEKLISCFPQLNVKQRFIPYFSMHEFESLLFSDISILCKELSVTEKEMKKILVSCKGDPEEIDKQAPSKILEKFDRSYKKTVTGIFIAKKIGLPKMLETCSCFNDWNMQLQNLHAL